MVNVRYKLCGGHMSTEVAQQAYLYTCRQSTMKNVIALSLEKWSLKIFVLGPKFSEKIGPRDQKFLCWGPFSKVDWSYLTLLSPYMFICINMVLQHVGPYTCMSISTDRELVLGFKV